MIASRCRGDLAPDCATNPPFGVIRKNGFVVTVSTRASPAHSFPSDAICKRRPVGYAGLWFRGNFAFGWFTDGLPVRRPAFCSFSRLALGLDLLSSFAFCLCGSLHLRDPGSFSLCLLGRFALDLAGGFTLGLLRRPALRAFGSLDLRFLSGFALCLPRLLALGFSRSVALRLLGSFTLRSLDGFEPRLLCCLALRLLRSFAPGFLRGGKPCPLGCGFATRGLSPGLFSKRVELCGPVVCLLDRSRTVGGIELCLLCSGLELHHLLPCRICVSTTLLCGAF